MLLEISPVSITILRLPYLQVWLRPGAHYARFSFYLNRNGRIVMSVIINNSKEIIFVRVKNFNDPEHPPFFIEDYGQTLKMMSWKQSKELLKKLNQFYDKYSKEDIETIQQQNEERRTQKRNEQWEKEFGAPYPYSSQEQYIKSKIKTAGYIYFLKADNIAIKIGKTISLKKRFDQIQPALPFKTHIIHPIKTSD